MVGEKIFKDNFPLRNVLVNNGSECLFEAVNMGLAQW